MLKQLLQDTLVCVTVSHPDGLVLARSAVNHTMNYRSAMIYGQFDKVADIGQQPAAMDALMKKPAPGRLAHVRSGSAKEYAATTVLRIAPDECAVKQRTGGPLDDAGDMAHDVWTGRTALHARPWRGHRRCTQHQRDARLRSRMGIGIRLTRARACPMIGVDGDSHQQTHS